MNQANIASLEIAVTAIEEILGEVAFVEITSRSAYYRLEEKLRELGFHNAQEEGVICRFRQSETDLILDVMPTEASILGFENRWLRESFPHAVPRELPSGRKVKVVPPVYLVATKLEAFRSRGKDDLYASKDFEDLIRLLDGREELVGELAGADDEVRSFVAEEIDQLSRHRDFDAAAEGAIGGGPETLDRYEEVVRPRVEAVTPL